MNAENVLIGFLVKVRDAASGALDELTPAEVKAPSTVSEKTFDLTYVKRTGAKIGEFEIADEKDSPKDLYERALGILKQNGATISKRYHGDGYVYAYWEYQNKIWRQKLKK